MPVVVGLVRLNERALNAVNLQTLARALSPIRPMHRYIQKRCGRRMQTNKQQVVACAPTLDPGSSEVVMLLQLASPAK